MIKKRLTSLLALTLLLAGLLLPVGAYAANPLTNACNQYGGAGSNSSACSADGSQDPISGQNGVLKRTTLVLAIIAGIAAVIVIIFSGFQLIVSGGDSQKVAQARMAILGAIIGLVIISVSASLIIFVVSKL